MLSAFTARPVIELKQRDKSKIETILANGDRILVGLNTGALRVYRLNSLPDPAAPTKATNGAGAEPTAISPGTSPRPNSKSGPSTKPTDLLREVEKFSSKPIEQLAIIKEANTLVSLSNYHVSLHDLQTYEPIDTLQRSKNASCFAVTSNIIKDADTGIPDIISRLAVAVKRRLLIWSWRESELSEDVTEVVLSEAIRTITWASATKVVVGMNAGYVLVDITTSETTEIIGSSASGQGAAARFGAASMGYMGLGGYMPKPLATRLAEGEMLLAKDINSLFLDAETGKPIESKRQVPWQSAPDGLGYSYPYILALMPPTKGALEVRNPESLSLLQTINLLGAAQLHFAPPTYSLAHAGKGFYVSSDRAVWKMDATDYDTQVQELIDKERFDEAISVVGMLEDALMKDKQGTLREVKMRKAEGLFRKKKFRDSLDLFNEDDVQAPPERVLRLFPPTIAGNLSAEAQDDVEGETEPEFTTEEEQSQEQQSQEQQSQEPQSQEPQSQEPQTQGSDSDGGKTNGDKNGAKANEIEPQALSPGRGGAFAKYWRGHRKTDSDAASIASSSQRGTDDDTTSVKDATGAPSKNRKPQAGSATLQGKELLSAVRELNSYLAGTRARLQRVIDPATGRLKPKPATAGDNNLASLLSHPEQSESDGRLEEELRKTFTLVDTTLFRAYMYSQPTLAGSLFRIPNFCDPAVVNEKLLENDRYAELVDFFYGKGLHREALELLRKFGTASSGGSETDKDASSEADDAGQELKRTTTTVEKSKLTGHSHDADAREIEIPEQLRGARRTVMYLQSLPPTLIDLVLEYSQWVLESDPKLGMEIFIADTENAETLPRDRVVNFLSKINPHLEIQYLQHIIDELGDATPEFHNRLAKLMITTLKSADRRQQQGWDQSLEKLVEFLRTSRQYSLTKAFELMPRDDPAFYEAHTVVLSNMGQHKQALEIYVFKMKDYAKAEEYCNRVHKTVEATSLPPTPPSTSPTPTLRHEPLPPASPSDQDDPDGTPSIYHTLLSLYLTPPSPHSPNLVPALDLLSRHGSRLPAASTLSLIPDTLPVAELSSYFRSRIRAVTSAVNEARVVEGLRKVQLVDTQAELLLGDGVPGGQGGRNRRVVIGEERVCGVCHKRLGNSVVAVLPDNGVVHYGCLARVGQSRKTSEGSGRIAGAWGRGG